MQKRKFTVVTQLHEKNNLDLIKYMESSRHTYAEAVRKTFYAIRNLENFNKSNFNTYLQDSYGITKRTASAIILDTQGHFNSLKELKRYEVNQLKRKISYLEEHVIPKLVKKRNDNSKFLQAGIPVSLTKQRNLRLKIVAKKAKLNKLKQKLSNLNYQSESGKLKLCFGAKKLFKQNYDGFVEQRDNRLSFVGAKTETCCNQLLQLTYNRKNNQFMILRRDFGGYKSAKGNDKYVYGKIYFNHYKDKIISILQNKNSPLSYRIIKKNGRYYLYCTFEIQADTSNFFTCSDHGTIGLDFNKGFITLSETNQYGHLIRTEFLPYRFKSGNKTKTNLQEIVNHVTALACQMGKDICIEDLNFKTTKSKTEAKQDKQYNEMIHSLAYRQFTDIIESAAYRNKVTLIKVNPAWTSWLAKKLFCPTMKLNVHVGASYVIARRGQGYKDTVKSL